MAVKYLGSSCQFEVCEAGCPGQHEFYRARILPPRVVPEEPASSSCSAELAASLAQAHAAASGRPVLLILDLHPRLRSHSLEGLMQIDTPEQLQVGWCEGLCIAPAVLFEYLGSGSCIWASSHEYYLCDDVGLEQQLMQRRQTVGNSLLGLVRKGTVRHTWCRLTTVRRGIVGLHMVARNILALYCYVAE